MNLKTILDELYPVCLETGISWVPQGGSPKIIEQLRIAATVSGDKINTVSFLVTTQDT